MSKYNDKCVFCKIIKGEESSEKIHEDEDLVCIKDIHPASTHHYLIIPKVHIADAKALKPSDEELYDKIVATVDVIAEKQSLDKAQIRTGFHWPPFTTISHLHLHVICPVDNMGIIHRTMFKPNSYWFVSTDYVKSRLQACS